MAPQRPSTTTKRTIHRRTRKAGQTKTKSDEPIVHESAPLPPSYTFVPKGDPYVTRNCRSKAQAASNTVCVVVDDNRKPIGIRVPKKIHASVISCEVASRLDRRRTLEKFDQYHEDKFKAVVKDTYAGIPTKDLQSVVGHAMKKKTGRVGRTTTVDLQTKAALAVRAHIRHTATDYDELLDRRIMKRGAARSAINSTVNNVAASWGEKCNFRQLSQQTNKAKKIVGNGRIQRRSTSSSAAKRGQKATAKPLRLAPRGKRAKNTPKPSSVIGHGNRPIAGASTVISASVPPPPAAPRGPRNALSVATALPSAQRLGPSTQSVSQRVPAIRPTTVTQHATPDFPLNAPTAPRAMRQGLPRAGVPNFRVQKNRHQGSSQCRRRETLACSRSGTTSHSCKEAQQREHCLEIIMSAVGRLEQALSRNLSQRMC